ncbi:hypothetical protein cypCar_00015618, partial [Cyprinus carpio]
PKGTVQGLNKVNNDIGQRAQNLSVLFYHIRSYYQETLHQLIMMPPPSVLLLGRNPLCEEGLEEIRMLLLLLLGCAVQCERKEEYIEKIQSLDFDTKAAIAAHIQKVTHCQENVFDLHWLGMEGLCQEEWENLCRNMSINLKMLVDQRDRQFEAIVELMQGKETMKSVVFGDDSSLTESTSSQLPLSQQHLALELADAKARIKCLRQELEEKCEQLLECRQDLDSVEAEVKRLQQEEDNQVLMESKAMLEEELQGVKARSEKLHHLEKHKLLLESKLHDIEEERTVDRRRIEELLERNIILELSQKRSMEESKHLGWELELAKNPQQNSESKSLGQEVTEVTCSRLLKLEKENQRLLKALEELQGTSRPLDDIISESKHIEENGRMDIVDYKTHKSTPAFANMHNGQIITPTLKTSNYPLDPEQLHTSLENTNSNLHCLEVHVYELETEKQRPQVNFNQNQGRADIKNQGLVHENGDLEQDRSCLEKENRRLRQQVKIKEVSLDCSNLKLVVLEKENRTLVKKSNYLSEACTKNKELEKENQELIQQTGVDKRMLMTLREELLDQRLKLQQKESDLENLTYELERMRLNQESRIGDHEAVDQGLSQCKQLESELESSLMKSLKIKKERMAALEARLQASAKINQQLRQDLKTVKQNYEALLQRDEEEKAGQCSPPERTWHRESQEATWALLRLKDRLIEVERNVEKSTLSSQNSSLMAHNAQLQRERQSSEAERESAIREREDLHTVNELLLRDHERLSVLHERQAAELEVLSHRYNTLLQQRSELEGLERALREEQQKMQNEICTNSNTTAECQRLRDEKDWLNQTYQRLLAENEELQVEHKSIKSQLNSCKLEQTLLESELSKLKEQNQQLEITSIKLTNQCELLTQLKGNLEEENRHLLDQIQSLMLQNQTLLDQTMESKDLFHVEQRQYIDKLNELRRQKEKLEEKILDQYKFYDPSPPRRRGNWITLKMRKMMKTRTRDQEHVRSSTPQLRSGSCEGLDDLRNHDNGSSVGSQGSEESASNSLNGDTVSPKRSS